MKQMATFKRTTIGYWWSKYDKKWPKPEPHPKKWKGRKKFLKRLGRVEGSNQVVINHYKGSSNCRVCNKSNGSTEYRLGNYIWPEGYAHYVKEHGIKPPKEFRKFIKAEYKKLKAKAKEKAREQGQPTKRSKG